MPVKIENLTDRPVFLRLNSGKTLHLAPRATTKEILDVEGTNNDKVKKLHDRHVIVQHEVIKKKKPSAASKKPIPKPTGKKAKSTTGKK